jgi:hypothetical protein
MPVDPVTHQQLLELVYDLLAAPQAAELRRRIESEPELAEAYVEARRTAGLLAEAARVEAPKVDYRRTQRSQVSATAPRGRPSRTRSSPWARGANWAVSIAASVLLAFSLGGYIYHRQELADLAASHMRLLVTGPARLQQGLANTYTIAASTATGTPLAAKIELALYSPAGKPLLRQEEDTDTAGRASLIVPAELNIPAEARLEVSASYKNKRETLDANFPVAAERYAAHLELDRPWYRPGDTARFRAVVLSRSKLTADRDQAVELSVVDGSGRVLAGFPIAARTNRGVAQGEWSIPASLAGGRHTLLLQSPSQRFAAQRGALVIRADERAELDKQLEFSRPAYRGGETVVAYFSARRRDGRPAVGARLSVVATLHGARIYHASPAPLAERAVAIRFSLPPSLGAGDARLAVTVLDAGRSETLDRPIPLTPAKLEVRFQPEGGSLVAGLRNRVYFAAADGGGQAVEVRGVVVDSRDQEVADLETIQAGMGLVSFTPSAGEQYRARLLTPVGATEEPALPEVSSDSKAVLSTGPGVFPAGRPLEFEIDSLRGGLPLVVAATCRGVLVGQQTLATSDAEPRSKVSLALTPIACGVIRLAVYEYRADRPRLVAQRLVYRHPDRRLQITLRDGQRPYAPGQQMKLSLQASNEKGEPVQAMLGIAAGPDDDSSSASRWPALPVDFYADGQLAGAERLGDPSQWLSEDPKAAAALDLLLGTQAPRSAPAVAGPEAQVVAADELEPPAVLDNLGTLRAEYEKNLAAYRAERTKALNTLTTLSFFGGFGLVLLVAMLATLKVISGIRLWVPAFAAATACLLVGATLMNPDRFQPGLGSAVAYVPYRGPTELALNVRSGAVAGQGTFAMDQVANAEKPPRSMVVAAPALPAELAAPAATPTTAPAATAAPERPAAEAAPRDEARPFMAGAEVFRQRVIQQKTGQSQDQESSGGRQLQTPASPPLEKGLRSPRMQASSVAGAMKPAVAAAQSEPPRRPRKAKTPSEAKSERAPAATVLAWRPAVETDAQGRSELSLQLREPGAYRVRVDGHASGRLGYVERVFQSQIPCQLEAKTPAELTLGDRAELPLRVTNPTGAAATVEVAFQCGPQLKLQGSDRRKLELKPGESRQELFRVEAIAAGECTLAFQGAAGKELHASSADRTLAVVPRGYPACRAASGRLRGNQTLSVDLPAWQPGSLDVALCVMPTLLAELERAYPSIDRRAEACGEQAAAAAWLSALALEWIERSDATWPQVVRRWRGRLDESLTRLARYEAAPRGFGGYQWFVAHPAHEALSAFVLAALDDVGHASGLAAGREHLSTWLRARLDAKGDVRQDPKSPPTGLSPGLLGACLTWSLARHDPKGLETPLKQTARLAIKSENWGQVALAAGALVAAGVKSEAAPLLDRLARAQRDDGRVPGEAAVQATALAAIAWLQAGRTLPADKALAWLSTARQADGGFGPPHATALVMRAMAEQAKTRPAEAKTGKLSLRAGDTLLAEQTLVATDPGPLVTTGLARHFRPGKNDLSLSLAALGSVDYTLGFRLATDKPPNANGPVAVTVRLESPQVRLGQTVGLAIEVSNATEQVVRLPVVEIGLPAGLEPRAEQLPPLKKLDTIDQFAVHGRRLAFYWQSFEGRKKTAFRLDLAATVVGQFQGPASTAYLHPAPDAKSFAAPLRVEVVR